MHVAKMAIRRPIVGTSKPTKKRDLSGGSHETLETQLSTPMMVRLSTYLGLLTCGVVNVLMLKERTKTNLG